MRLIENIIYKGREQLVRQHLSLDGEGPLGGCRISRQYNSIGRGLFQYLQTQFKQ